MAYSLIQYDVSDNIATITLNRPEKMNAFTREMADEIMSALDVADKDDDVRAIIFTGSGRAFCAGADLTPDKGGGPVCCGRGNIGLWRRAGS